MQSKFLAKDCACHDHRDIVCLHCAKYTKLKNRRTISAFHEQNWLKIYGNFPDLSYAYKPTIICDVCAKYLERRADGKCGLKYLTPAIFKKPTKKHQNCYIKLVHELVSKDLNLKKYPDKIPYPTISNLVNPVKNTVRAEEEDDGTPVEAFELNLDIDDEDEVQSFSELYLDDEEDVDYVPEEPKASKRQKVSKSPVKQVVATNLIKVLKLPPDHAEVLCSFLKRYTETELGFRITTYRQKTVMLKELFRVINGTVVLVDIRG